MTNLVMMHEEDPKKVLMDKLGDISDLEVFNNQVVLATYVRPNKTKSGLYITDKYRDEDLYQGKIGMLIKKGPLAFDTSADNWFGDSTFEIGDWLLYRPSDGWNITVHGVACRVLGDNQVKGRVTTPDSVF